jgi:hypothetical protein
LVVLLFIGACRERYLIAEDSLEQTIRMTPEQRRRVALRAVREQDRQTVWVFDRQIRVEPTETRGFVRARATRLHPLTIAGIALAAVTVPVFLAAGGGVQARGDSEAAQVPACRAAAGGWGLCGLDADMDHIGAGILFGVAGAFALVSLSIALAGVVRKAAEVDVGERELIYVP